jgi:hypothetical protein
MQKWQMLSDLESYSAAELWSGDHHMRLARPRDTDSILDNERFYQWTPEYKVDSQRTSC